MRYLTSRIANILDTCSSTPGAFVILTNIQAYICEYIFLNNSPLNTAIKIFKMVHIVCADSMGYLGIKAGWSVSFDIHVQKYLNSLRYGDTIWQ